MLSTSLEWSRSLLKTRRRLRGWALLFLFLYCPYCDNSRNFNTPFFHFMVFVLFTFFYLFQLKALGFPEHLVVQVWFFHQLNRSLLICSYILSAGLLCLREEREPRCQLPPLPRLRWLSPSPAPPSPLTTNLVKERLMLKASPTAVTRLRTSTHHESWLSACDSQVMPI